MDSAFSIMSVHEQQPNPNTSTITFTEELESVQENLIQDAFLERDFGHAIVAKRWSSKPEKF